MWRTAVVGGSPRAKDSARDTDADWRELGATQPYWGVLTHPEFRSESITPEGIEAFYLSGRQYISKMIEDLIKLAGEPPSGPALDFGCGVGRLTEAMADHVSTTGLDVSPGMLAIARKRGGKAAYTETLPDGPFGWINSCIVFQHIAPQRGLNILEDLLARLAPGGMISIHITVWRDARHDRSVVTGWRRWRAERRYRAWVRNLPVGEILMYDYDLSKVIRLVNQAGIEEMTLVSTDHDGHHGVIILGRKTAQSSLV
jgi:SAM-dependent methyltransferase